jgi:hypothetical protein
MMGHVMVLLSDVIIKNYMVPYINNKWTNMQKVLSGSKINRQRLPFAVEEAVLNTALTGSIYKYMLDNSDYDSILVSEAAVKRANGGKGRCDLVWYTGKDVYYMELKGSFYYGFNNSNTTVNEAFKYLNSAVEQVYSITSKDMLIHDGLTDNEYYYGLTPKNRYGFVAGIILSEVSEDEKSSNFDKIGESINNKISSTNKEFYTRLFSYKFGNPSLDISYYKNKDQKENARSDGYYLICAEFSINENMQGKFF